MTAEVLVDFEKDIAFFLYEYGRSLVKNSSQRNVDTFDITMRTPDGTDHSMTGTIYCGDDRLYIDQPYVDEVLTALQGEGNIGFYIEKTDRSVQNYLITVTASNFAEEYGVQTAQ